MSSHLQQISNWGNFPTTESVQLETDKISAIRQFLQENESIVPRGNERCYGDAALHTHSFKTTRLNRLISFDRDTGKIKCEAGVLLSDILEVSVPAGYFLPVTPGTKFITVGGALASDVHGKNHHVDGCFSDHVYEFSLLNGQGEVVVCSPNENASIFWATMGGMGLTGIILDVTFQLKPIESAYIKHEAIKAKNLDEIFELFESSMDWTYTVAWIDCLQKGKSIGRSILMRGEHAKLNELPEKWKQKPLELKPKGKLAVPFQFPSFALNTLSVKAFNFLYYHKQTTKHLKNFIDYDTFFYPLDAIYHWNRIYGKKGFIQYQFVIPKEHGKKGMQEILDAIAQSGQGSFLAVLKLFGENNPLAYNAFPIEGYTLALDFKWTPKLKDLVAQLDQLVTEYQGRIYRAKDSMSAPSLTNYVKDIPVKGFYSQQQKRYDESKISY